MYILILCYKSLFPYALYDHWLHFCIISKYWKSVIHKNCLKFYTTKYFNELFNCLILTFHEFLSESLVSFFITIIVKYTSRKNVTETKRKSIKVIYWTDFVKNNHLPQINFWRGKTQPQVDYFIFKEGSFSTKNNFVAFTNLFCCSSTLVTECSPL